MPYELDLRDDRILHVRFIGNVGPDEWSSYIRDYESFLESAAGTDSVHFLVDVNEMGKASARTRKAVVADLRTPNPRVGKTAMIGTNRYARVLTSFLLKAVGRDDIRFFETVEDAMAWLKQ